MPLERKNTQNHENRRLCLIESLHMQHCSLRGCIRPTHHLHPSAGFSGRYSIFKITRMGSMIQKEIKYNLHYHDVRGDFLRPPNGTPAATVEWNKSQKGLPLERKNTQNHVNRRLGLIESLHMQHCSLRGCIHRRRRLKRYSIFKIARIQRCINHLWKLFTMVRDIFIALKFPNNSFVLIPCYQSVFMPIT